MENDLVLEIPTDVRSIEHAVEFDVSRGRHRAIVVVGQVRRDAVFDDDGTVAAIAGIPRSRLHGGVGRGARDHEVFDAHVA